MECGFEKEIRKIIEVYNESGIVTRNDVSSMDLYSFAKKAHKELINKGYEHINMIMIFSKNRLDYSSVIYNYEEYLQEQVEEYMINNVLHENE